MSVAATAIGLVAFAESEHISWAWVTIVALLLVTSLAMELRVAHRCAEPVRALLERAITDGNAILEVHGPGVATGNLWMEWANETARLLKEHVGLVESHKFRSARPPNTRTNHLVSSLDPSAPRSLYEARC